MSEPRTMTVERLLWTLVGSNRRERQRGSRRHVSTVLHFWIRRKLDRAKRDGWQFVADPVVSWSNDARDLYQRDAFAFALKVKAVRAGPPTPDDSDMAFVQSHVERAIESLVEPPKP